MDVLLQFNEVQLADAGRRQCFRDICKMNQGLEQNQLAALRDLFATQGLNSTTHANESSDTH